MDQNIMVRPIDAQLGKKIEKMIIGESPDDKDPRYFGVVQGKTVYGVVRIRVHAPQVIPRIMISFIGVLAGHRQKGYGRMMIQQLQLVYPNIGIRTGEMTTQILSGLLMGNGFDMLHDTGPIWMWIWPGEFVKQYEELVAQKNN